MVVLRVSPISIGGIKTVVHIGGRSDATETVVFVHGNPGPLDDWEVLAPAVSDLFRVVAMDLPGFGRADRPKSFDYSNVGYANFIGELLNAVGANRVHLVAHDFGGAWATAWAERHRDQVASITLIDAPVIPSFRWHLFARVWQAPIAGELFQLLAVRPLIKAVMLRDNPRPLPKEFLERVAQHANLAQKLRVLQIYRAARDPATTFAISASTLKEMDPPACIIWGANDPYADIRYVEDTRALFSDCEVHIIERAGHWPFIDDPQRVTAAVRDFLTRQARGHGVREPSTTA